METADGEDGMVRPQVDTPFLFSLWIRVRVSMKLS
jgi:hypothetical protein